MDSHSTPYENQCLRSKKSRSPLFIFGLLIIGLLFNIPFDANAQRGGGGPSATFNNPPTPVNGTTFVTSAGNTVSFPVQASSPHINRPIVDMSQFWGGAPPAAYTFTQSPPSQIRQEQFSFQPQLSDWGFHYLRFTASTRHGYHQAINDVFIVVNTPSPSVNVDTTVGAYATFDIELKVPDLDIPFGDNVNISHNGPLPQGLYFNPNPQNGSGTLHVSGGTLPVGVHNLQFTVKDTYSQHTGASTLNLELTIESPCNVNAVAQDISVALDPNGIATVNPSSLDNGSTASCGIASLSASPSSFDCSQIGTHPVVLTVTDNNGNTASASANVTVTGQIPTVTIASVPTDPTFTGGDPNNLYLGYGAQSTVLQSAASNGNSFSYAWTGSDLDCYNCAAPEFTPTIDGIYSFNVVVTNDNGCSISEDIVVNVEDIRSKNNKVYLCHNSGSKTLSISVNAVAAHLNNHAGDALGVCGSSARQAVENDMQSDDEVQVRGLVDQGASARGHIGNSAHFDSPPTPYSEILASPTDLVTFPVQTSSPDNNQSVSARWASGTSASAFNLSFVSTTSSSRLDQFTWNSLASDWGLKTVELETEGSDHLKVFYYVPILLNTVPLVSSNPVTLVESGSLYTYNMASNDPDLAFGDEVSFVPNSPLPTWLTLNTDPLTGTAVLSGTPGSGDVGIHNLSFRLEDTYHQKFGVGTHDFTIEVESACTPSVVSIASVPSSATYTGGDPNNLYMGYGAQSTVLQSTASNLNAIAYAWTGSDLDCYNCAAPVFTPSAAGTYAFDLTVTNSGGCSVTESISICVKDITGNKNNKVYLCHNSNNPKTVYISENAVPAHLNNHAGDYLGDCNAVCGPSARFEAPVGELFAADGIELIIFPNPSHNNFKLDIQSSIEGEITIRVMDLGGRILESHMNVNAAQTLEFGAHLASGFYLVSIQQGDYNEVIRVEKLN